MIIWISSYPKSGNTWLRSLISSYYFTKDGNFEFGILKNIPQFPKKDFFKQKISKPGEISLYWESAQDEIIKDKKIKFLKTHNSLLAINGNNFTTSKHALGAIYILRDPRNVLTSLCNHYELSYDEGISFMTNDRKSIIDPDKKDDFSNFQYISSWSNHVTSWTKTNLLKKITIKYEDLENNPQKVLYDIILYINSITNFETEINEEKLKNCLKTTEFNTLQTNEKENGFIESIKSKNSKKKIKFCNLGFENKWKKVIPKIYHEKINELFKQDLVKLGYKLD